MPARRSAVNGRWGGLRRRRRDARWNGFDSAWESPQSRGTTSQREMSDDQSCPPPRAALAERERALDRPCRSRRNREDHDPRCRRCLQLRGRGRPRRLCAAERGGEGRTRGKPEHALRLRRRHAVAIAAVGVRQGPEHHRPDQPRTVRHRGSGQPRVRFRAGKLP